MTRPWRRRRKRVKRKAYSVKRAEGGLSRNKFVTAAKRVVKVGKYNYENPGIVTG